MSQQILILGAGYAGMMNALRLAKKTQDEDVQITLVNMTPHFIERVRLHQHATNQDIQQVPIESLIKGLNIRFVQGKVVSMQPKVNSVTVNTNEGEQVLSYHILVYALGSRVDRETIPGIREHANTLDWASSQCLAKRLAESTETSKRMVVVGAGATGLEAATEFAESYPHLKIQLLTRGTFNDNLSAKGDKYLRKALDKLNITLQENIAVTQIEANQLVCDDGTTIPFDFCVWAGGFRALPLAKDAGLAVNDIGQIVVGHDMRSVSYPNIFAVGDSAIAPQQKVTAIRMSLYTAMMMGMHGADAVTAQVKGEDTIPFGLNYIAMGISLGRKDAIIQFLRSDDSPYNFIMTGRVAVFYKEFFTRFAFWAMKFQKVAPDLFYWLGKNKLKDAPLETIAIEQHAREMS